jgi:hypothetical protein
VTQKQEIKGYWNLRQFILHDSLLDTSREVWQWIDILIDMLEIFAHDSELYYCFQQNFVPNFGMFAAKIYGKDILRETTIAEFPVYR